MKTILPLLILPLLLGCSPSTANQKTAIEAVDASVNAVAAIYEEEQRACLRDSSGKPEEDKCIAEVRERWAPARTSILTAAAAIRAAMGAK